MWNHARISRCSFIALAAFGSGVQIMLEFLRPVPPRAVIDLSTAHADEPPSSGTVRDESEPDPAASPFVALSIKPVSQAQTLLRR
jgi:hypothetical protein